MRKLAVIGASDYFCSGSAIYTISLANELNKAGQNQVIAILVRELAPRFLYPGRDHIGKYRSPDPLAEDIVSYQKMDWYSPLSWLRGYLFMKKEKPDVIIMQWWTSAILHILLFLAVMNGITTKAKLIIEMHVAKEPLELGNWFVRIYCKLVSPMLMKQADAIITHADSVSADAIEEYGFEKRKVYSIPLALFDMHEKPGNRQTARNELGIKEPFVILHFGMIRKYKGVPKLIQAFNDLPESVAKESRLIIAGEDWKEDVVIRDIVNSSRYRDQITLDDRYIPNEMVPKYFAAADVVAITHIESVGNAVPSLTMAYGKPMIAPNLDAMQESLAGYEGVSFFQAGNIAELTRSLEASFINRESLAGKIFRPPAVGWGEIVRHFADIINGLISLK